MHPNKHIREALKYAEEHGWQFTKSRGHPFGRIRCSFGHRRCQMWIWSTPRSPENHARAIRKTVDACPGVRSMTMPEFYLVLKDRDLHEQLAKTVFEAGFDDSELTVRGDHAAIWVCHREGELTQLVREALEQAHNGGLRVLHVEMENAVFA